MAQRNKRRVFGSCAGCCCAGLSTGLSAGCCAGAAKIKKRKYFLQKLKNISYVKPGVR